MTEGHWFTTIGVSPLAAFNTIWAAYLEYDWHPVDLTLFRLIPSNVRKATTDRLESSYSEFLDWLKRFGETYDLHTEVETSVCAEEDYEAFVRMFRAAVRKCIDVPRAIDITPGRKFASAIGLGVGIEERVDHIYYLHLLDDTYTNQPLPQIPRPLVKLIDFKKGLDT